VLNTKINTTGVIITLLHWQMAQLSKS